ncbi:MAG: hypothetical protein V4498_05360 [candidate division FCPU426 bacterium]
METKKAKDYIDHSLGFPVHLGQVTMVKVRGEWAPKVDYARLAPKVLRVLSRLERPLHGQEVRFVRLHFNLTQQTFAEKFGVSHVAVHKWERSGVHATGMQWSTEKDLRLFIQSCLSPDPVGVGRLYEQLTKKRRPSSGPTKQAEALEV